MSILVKKTNNGRYKICKKWPLSQAENTIVITKQEIADLVDILVDLQNNEKFDS